MSSITDWWDGIVSYLIIITLSKWGYDLSDIQTRYWYIGLPPPSTDQLYPHISGPAEDLLLQADRHLAAVHHQHPGRDDGLPHVDRPHHQHATQERGGFLQEQPGTDWQKWVGSRIFSTYCVVQVATFECVLIISDSRRLHIYISKDYGGGVTKCKWRSLLLFFSIIACFVWRASSIKIAALVCSCWHYIPYLPPLSGNRSLPYSAGVPPPERGARDARQPHRPRHRHRPHRALQPLVLDHGAGRVHQAAGGIRVGKKGREISRFEEDSETCSRAKVN